MGIGAGTGGTRLARHNKSPTPHARPFLSQVLGITIPIKYRGCWEGGTVLAPIGPVGLGVDAIRSPLYNWPMAPIESELIVTRNLWDAEQDILPAS